MGKRKIITKRFALKLLTMIITNTFGKNVNFKNQRRKNSSYNGHVKQCFNIKENRNKETLKKFEDTIRNYIESSETMKINGSYR